MTMPKDWKPPSSYSYKSAGSDNIQTGSNFPRILTPSNSQVFISYAREDQQAAMRLYNEIKSSGLNPWIDRKRILPGQKWEKEIEKAIKNSAYFIPLFSSNSVQKLKGYVQNEFKFALDMFESFKNIAGFKVYYIPVRLDDCDVPYQQLRPVHIADLFPYEENWKEGFEGIVQVIHNDIKTANDLFEYQRVAEELHDAKKYNESLRWYLRAAQIEPHPTILISIGYCLLNLQRYDEAIEWCEKIIRSPSPGESLQDAWYLMGLCLYSLGRYQEAIECYDKALELDPNCAACWNNKGYTLYSLGRYQEAIECYDKALELDPHSSTYSNNKNNALTALKANYKDRELTPVEKLGVQQMEESRAKGIIPGLTPLDKLGIRSRVQEEAKAEGLSDPTLIDLRYYHKTSEIIRGYLNSSSAANMYSREKDELQKKVFNAYDTGKYDTAINFAEQILEANPFDWYAWNAKGAALIALGRFNESLDCINRTLEINPNKFTSWLNKGTALSRLGRYSEAIGCFDVALKLNSNYAIIWNEKGKALMALGESFEANECFDRSKKLTYSGQ
jgi:tetratricopeptide (TPR) repeat protein